MKRNVFFNGWVPAVILPVLVIIAGGILIYRDARGTPGVEISVVPEKPIVGKLYLGGGVENPGIYEIYPGDTIDDIVRAAGGLKNGVELNGVELIIPTGDTERYQKVNINRAEAWLLEALPGIGEVKAQAIIAYRQQYGYFHDTREILNIPGFSNAIYNGIKDFITVYD